MKGYIEGKSRAQLVLMPESLDDFIGDDNPVRVIDLFVDELDLQGLGFAAAQPAVTGRPGYHPGLLLKLYIYGYLNRVQSSRRLEREAQRNVEVMWLTGHLSPDFKTIADFRRDNGAGIRNACKQFIAICRELNLFSHAVVAIDGSKFKAVNNRDKNFTTHKLEQRIKQIEESIDRYMHALDTADRTQPAETEAKTKNLKEKLVRLRKQMRYLQEMGEQLRQAPDEQVSLTDPDARSMATSGRGTGMVGYNVQVAVDTEHHLIVANDVVNVGHDRTQLASMAMQAKAAVDEETLEALADRGYYKGPEILTCEQSGITPFVPMTMTSDNKARGLFDKRDFVYQPDQDAYRCPSGQVLPRHHQSVEQGLVIHTYYSLSACMQCPIKAQCTTAEKERRVRRWEHEAVLESMQRRLDACPGKMRQRRSTVEHVFGTLKSWMGATHFLTKTRPRVQTEMSLHVLAYNLRRIISLYGPKGAMDVVRRAAA
ncbi:MAG: IS1182 family transposase [Zoogloeaceae bacterium]|nr:IS1182 family transposase [Zoogloeaceae bacterium]